jgi:hypothetical protein
LTPHFSISSQSAISSHQRASPNPASRSGEDDIYGDIYFGRERPKPFMALADQADVIYCSSFSKTLAPGYRVAGSRPSAP